MNKKGFFTDPIVDVFAFIAYVLIVLIFFVIFSLGRGEIQVEISGELGDIDSYIILRNFLRTPVKLSELSEETYSFGGFSSGEPGGGGAVRTFESDEFIPPSIPVADLVPLFDMEKNQAYDVFVRYARNFFNKQYGGWELHIIDLSDQSSLKILPQDATLQMKPKEFFADQIIPGFHNKSYKIELYYREIVDRPLSGH